MASPIKKSAAKKYSRSMSHLANKRDDIVNKRFQNNNKYYLDTKARSYSVKVIISNYLKSVKANEIQWAYKYSNLLQDVEIPEHGLYDDMNNIHELIQQNNLENIQRNAFDDYVNKPLHQYLGYARRRAIEYFYVQIFGLPPKYQWKDLDLVNLIMERLLIPYGSRHNVVWELLMMWLLQ